MAKEEPRKQFFSDDEVESEGMSSVNEQVKEKFYPDLPKIKFEDLVGSTIIILDVVILEDFPGEFGRHDLALIGFNNKLGEVAYTTACGTSAVTEKLQKLLDKGAIPIAGKIIEQATRDGKRKYYNII